MVGLRDGAFKVGVALLQGAMQSIAHILEASVDTDGMQEWFKRNLPRYADLDVDHAVFARALEWATAAGDVKLCSQLSVLHATAACFHKVAKTEVFVRHVVRAPDAQYGKS